MNTIELKKWVKNKIEENPNHKEEIEDLFELCLSEIEEGGSEFHEIILCMNDINELIN